MANHGSTTRLECFGVLIGTMSHCLFLMNKKAKKTKEMAIFIIKSRSCLLTSLTSLMSLLISNIDGIQWVIFHSRTLQQLKPFQNQIARKEDLSICIPLKVKCSPRLTGSQKWNNYSQVHAHLDVPVQGTLEQEGNYSANQPVRALSRSCSSTLFQRQNSSLQCLDQNGQYSSQNVPQQTGRFQVITSSQWSNQDSHTGREELTIHLGGTYKESSK